MPLFLRGHELSPGFGIILNHQLVLFFPLIFHFFIPFCECSFTVFLFLFAFCPLQGKINDKTVAFICTEILTQV